MNIELDNKPSFFNMAGIYMIIVHDWLPVFAVALNVRDALCIAGLQNTMENLRRQSSAR